MFGFSEKSTVETHVDFAFGTSIELFLAEIVHADLSKVPSI